MPELQVPFRGSFRVTCDYECHLSYSTAPGIDWALPRMTKVYAAAEGHVIYSEWGDRGGRYLMIRHNGPGLITLYSHLEAAYVLKGEHVAAGALIALSGNTGRSTGPHLHFAVKDFLDDAWVWVDPELYLP